MSKVDKKKLILAAATQSFSQFGYKATTMDLVAKIANVGKGTIYTFFTTKEELFEAILQNAMLEMKDAIHKGMREEDTFFQNLFRMLDLLLEFRACHELFIKLAQEFRDIGTQQALEGLQRLESSVLDYLRQEIDKAIQKEEIKSYDSEVLAFTILKLYLALATDWTKSQTRKPLDKEQIMEYVRLFVLDGLTTDKSIKL
ncbi:TetR/AcrR family transcriptional regulator [Paenibacillus radicis (ex Xue et al. 2023)]|uniref:TetR/AcrR family transcriptional regulator n=1 Tax=Paenibacillus radicis (ex Xue et al. 2023) TaxID=2972489 RepID=A0ABT1YIZ0_9BACL|nr:TetR/AcrR family transcriptional regulator [Paenibacillus radicis (ex Xue et al. 2023)]MCR8633143.1 TetR/AcrR family transcriptional regulator [Paenibacillus radicis (ex Xue et al. 2023)]